MNPYARKELTWHYKFWKYDKPHNYFERYSSKSLEFWKKKKENGLTHCQGVLMRDEHTGKFLDKIIYYKLMVDDIIEFFEEKVNKK